MKIPKVAIGLPVYNGEKYLREAIESCLNQDFEDLKLIISDNGSIDSTWDICREYANRDRRICLHRYDRNKGAVVNWKQVFNMSDSPYFMWMPHDDVLRPTYVSRCFSFLENHPDYLLCSSLNTTIDQQGNEKYTVIYDYTLDSELVTERYGKCLTNIYLPVSIYGLFRSEVLGKIHTRRVFPPDWVFMLELSIEGKAHQIREVLRYYRAFNKPISRKSDVMRAQIGCFGELSWRELLLPGVNFYMVVIFAILEKPLGARVKGALILLTFSRLRFLPLMQQQLYEIVRYVTYDYPSVFQFLRGTKRCLVSVAARLKRLM